MHWTQDVVCTVSFLLALAMYACARARLVRIVDQHQLLIDVCPPKRLLLEDALE